MTLYSLFWCMFGQVGTDSVIITYPAKPSLSTTSTSSSSSSGRAHASLAAGLSSDGATSIVESVGLMLFAVYHVTVIIVLINMLIAMMSHSFEDIQVTLYLCTLLQVARTCWRLGVVVTLFVASTKL